MGRALLLNASFEPLCVVPMRRAVVLVLKEKAEIIVRNGAVLHSERAQLPIPSVIRLRHFVRVPYRNRVPLSRRAVFARDGHRCQYCDRAAENIDHVVPRERGRMLLHDCDVIQGDSGSPLLLYADGTFYAIGLHTIDLVLS